MSNITKRTLSGNKENKMNYTHIVPGLQGFEVQVDDSNQLVIMNPPVIKAPNNEQEAEA